MKLKWLNRLASLQADGTVQFEIPDEIKPQNLAFGTKVVASGATEEEDFNTTTLPDLPPLQIVMLIVGTRGDVQPFVAIGKCLQVEYCFLMFLIKLQLLIQGSGHLNAFLYDCPYVYYTF